MNVRRPFSANKFCAVIGLLCCAAASFGQTVDGNPKVKQEVLDRITASIGVSAFVPGIDFSKWPQFLSEEKAAIDASKNDEEFRAAVNEALHKFGASHVVLLTPRSSQTRRSGATVGVGISLQIDPEGLVVVRVVKDSAADKAGLVVGDIVVEVDGKPVATSPNLSGEEGSSVNVKVKHSDGKIEDYKLVRRKYSTIRPAELIWVDADTAQLKIYSFDTASYDRSAITELVKEARKAKNLILDLRFNGGGAVSNLQHLLGMLIPDNRPVGTFIRRTTVSDYIESTGGADTDLAAIAEWSERKFRPIHRTEGPTFTGHIAVLVNKFSGSASEIAAAALHDVVGAPVIGTKSAGAVLASVIDPVSNGFSLQYPIEDYVTIKGIRLEGNGVTPDIAAQDLNVRIPNAHDDGIDKAVAYFSQSKIISALFSLSL